MQTSGSDTFIYDSSGTNSQTSILKVEHINQIKDEMENLAFYYTNCDSVLNKRDELQLEKEIYKPDIIILTEIFAKGIKSTDIMDQEVK